VQNASRTVAVVVAAIGIGCGSGSTDDTPRNPTGNAGGASATGGNGGNPVDASTGDHAGGGSSGSSGGVGKGGAGGSAGGTGGAGGGSAGSGASGGGAGTGGTSTGGTGNSGAGGAAGNGAAGGSAGARPDAAVDANSTVDARADQRGPATDAAADVAIDSSADTTTPPGSPPLVPPAGALLGVFFGAESVAITETMLTRKVAVRLTYYAWEDDWTRGNTSTDLAAGRIPLVNWEPHTPTLDDIINGVHDAMLHMRASSAKALGKPFFLDWGAEMNGNWSPWSGSNNGSSGAKYIAAYRHIHDIFVADGATNVVWAWCPNVTDEPRVAWNETMNYYPGDAYVDWTCVDGYNWGTTNGGGWQTFPQVFTTIYAKLATKGKPILIGEMASTEEGGDKGQWIAGMVPALKSNFPLIKGLVWFDINKETDWRIASSTGSRDAFIAMGKDPYMNP
jgi:hypothetical protein